MTIQIVILSAYFLVILIIGFFSKTKLNASPSEYFLSNRTLTGVLLISTMIATNFSAFTVYGTSGAGYRDGYAFFPIMAFGTGFMALSFWAIGRKAWQISKNKDIISPPELIEELYSNRILSTLFAIVMIVFTIPYLALQPMAAGYVLHELLGIKYFTGCVIVTVIILLYTFRGGLKAVAWTDLFQGIIMFSLLIVSLVIVSQKSGGFVNGNLKVFESLPELFSRPGGNGKFVPGIWFGFMALWFFCDPMFPQIFQRFFSAKDTKSLSITMLSYPLISTLVFFMPISIGVLGHLHYPGLVGKASDKIIPMMLTDFSGPTMAAFIMAAGLAALMSTMDSQLLTLSSIFSRDIAPLFGMKKTQNSLQGRIFVVCLAVIGLAMAFKPPDTILSIATQAFSGLAMLFPSVFFGLYMRKKYALPAILSIISGEIMVLLFHFNILKNDAVLPFLPSIIVSIAIYVFTHFVIQIKKNEFIFRFPKFNLLPFYLFYAIIFLLANDFWNWEKTPRLILGLPAWIFWFIGLSILQTGTMWYMIKKDEM